jgi:hypothetical protein
MPLQRRLGLMLFTLLGAAILAGCTQHTRGNPPGVAVVVGERSNSVPIAASNLPVGLVKSWVAEGATVTFVNVDGEPEETMTADLAASGPNNLYRQMSTATELERGTTDLLESRATVPEADTLGAIALAGRAVGGPSGGRLVVIDSGLDTVPPLAFQYGVLTDSPGQVVAFLRASDELPALGGVDVTWYGLGQVAAPQRPLSTAAIDHLESIWRAILLASGAARVDIIDAPLSQAPPHLGLPPVTAVAIPPVGSIGGEGPTRAVIVPLSAKSVDFVPGEAAYLDRSRADSVLGSLTKEIIDGGYHHVRVIGTAALRGWQELSQQRANTVMRTLVADGVRASEITAVGVGEDFAGFVPDLSPSGALEPLQSEEDRLVIVTAWR